MRTVTKWDKGRQIPKECKRLMRYQKRLELFSKEEWEGFKMKNDRLELPTGHSVAPQEILAGICLLEIQSELELSTTTKLLKFARAIADMK